MCLVENNVLLPIWSLIIHLFRCLWKTLNTLMSCRKLSCLAHIYPGTSYTRPEHFFLPKPSTILHSRTNTSFTRLCKLGLLVEQKKVFVPKEWSILFVSSMKELHVNIILKIEKSSPISLCAMVREKRENKYYRFKLRGTLLAGNLVGWIRKCQDLKIPNQNFGRKNAKF